MSCVTETRLLTVLVMCRQYCEKCATSTLTWESPQFGPKPRPRPVRKVVRPKAVPRLIDRGPPREINYFFYASPFIWGEEEWDEDEYWN